MAKLPEVILVGRSLWGNASRQSDIQIMTGQLEEAMTRRISIRSMCRCLIEYESAHKITLHVNFGYLFCFFEIEFRLSVMWSMAKRCRYDRFL
uniref:Uncharacterized protein n=1 Tax=Oryza punctata TaxID=4537 RepID=A0A0E0MJP5_ORYPU